MFSFNWSKTSCMPQLYYFFAILIQQQLLSTLNVESYLYTMKINRDGISCAPSGFGTPRSPVHSAFAERISFHEMKNYGPVKYISRVMFYCIHVAIFKYKIINLENNTYFLKWTVSPKTNLGLPLFAMP